MGPVEISDRWLITELLHSYAHAVDRADVEAVLAVFTDDAVLDMGRGTVASGALELRTLVLRLVGRWTATSHLCSTTSFTAYDGRSATAVTGVQVFHDRPTDPTAQAVTMLLWGRYDDQLVHSDGRWLVRHRVFRVAGVRQEPSQDLPDRFEPIERRPLPPA